MSRKDPEIYFKINGHHIAVRSSFNADHGEYDTISIKDSSNKYITRLWKSWDSKKWTMHLDDCKSIPPKEKVDEWLRENLKVKGIKGLIRKIGMRDEIFVRYPEWVDEGFFFI